MFFCTVKQTKTNLQKYFHPSFLNNLMYLCALAIPRANKRPAKGSIDKEDDSDLPLKKVLLFDFTVGMVQRLTRGRLTKEGRLCYIRN